jgi:hypothetical protein
MTTKTKKPAAKRAKKAVAPVVNPITAGSLVSLAKPKAGELNPVMTVTMLTAEYEGPKEFPVAECQWFNPVAGVDYRQRIRLDELQFVCTPGEATSARAQYHEAEVENARVDHERMLAKIAADNLAAQQALRAAQAAEQEQKGAI